MTDQWRPEPSRCAPDQYGESFADVYENWYAGVTDAAATARFVASRIPAGGSVLELGVGTGRLARPMVDLNLRVVGLDASATMLTHCAASMPDATLVRADMAALPLRGSFDAVLLGFNTLFNLGSSDRQQALFHELRSVVGTDGIVIVEALDAAVLADGPPRSVGVTRRDDHSLVVVGTQLDARRQTIVGQHVELSPFGVRHRPWTLCWATPSQIDGFAHSAGFTLAGRYADWEGATYSGGTADTHISVYTARAIADTDSNEHKNPNWACILLQGGTHSRPVRVFAALLWKV